MGGGNLGMGVCKHTVPFFFAPRSLQAEKAKGQGGPPWPFSRGCQTYWEACQKCGECLDECLDLVVIERSECIDAAKAKLIGHGVCMVRALDGRQEGTQRRRRDALVGAAHFLSHLGLSRHLGRARGVATPGITARACARGALFTVKPGVCPTPYRARATGYITMEWCELVVIG